MKAAVVKTYGPPPTYAEFDTPNAEPGEVLVRMKASALSNLARAAAEGRHYSSAKTLPIIPGVDGVGVDPEGRRVYVAFPRVPFGTMAEVCPIPKASCVPVPEGVSDALAAAIANPGMSSWAALHDRAHFQRGESVLVNGATGVSGGLAVRIAKHLGARRVIATGRDPAALQQLLNSGADAVISLKQEEAALTAAFHREFEDGGVDVVLDYLWGASAQALLNALPGHGSPRQGARLRYVQIGSISGETIPLKASTLRSSGLELIGSGLGSVSTARLLAGIGELFQIITAARLSVDFTERPLTEIESAWKGNTGGDRLVLTLA